MAKADSTARFDPEAVRAKYREERDKRLVAGRADIRDLKRDAFFARYRQDPFTPWSERAPQFDEVDVAIIGAGIAGLVAGAKLRQQGVNRIRLIDEAGGVGGTWYWNRYPGVMCDIESYIYMPMLEDMAYIPKHRYAFGDEIRQYLERLADTYDLTSDSLFQTRVQNSAWDEDSARWVIRTNRGDEFRARYIILAVGILNLMKLPAIPGMENFTGHSFHTARWDYGYTGGGQHGDLDQLADKVVGVIGTGASAIQCVPHLAASAKHLFVFQRTPSAVGVRDNGPTPADFTKDFSAGWQRRRMFNFQSILNGLPVDEDMVGDGWTRHMAKVYNPRRDPTMTPDEFMENAERDDFAIMEEHRARIDELVTNPRKAEILKPYYRYLCKRPCFHDEYLQAFSRENVTLVDCAAGIERVTEDGLVCNGEKYEFDCLIYATGFEAEMTPLPRRAGHEIVGREGLQLADKWKDGPSTLHGIMSRGFPNLFLIPAPLQQSVAGSNVTAQAVEGAEHIAATITLFDHSGVRTADVSQQAEDEYVEQIVAKRVDASAVLEACTPSRFNVEGNARALNALTGSYGGGRGDFLGFWKMLEAWREDGRFPGLELTYWPESSK